MYVYEKSYEIMNKAIKTEHHTYIHILHEDVVYTVNERTSISILFNYDARKSSLHDLKTKTVTYCTYGAVC